MSSVPHIDDMTNPAVSDDRDFVTFTLSLSDGRQIPTAYRVDDLSRIVATVLSYAGVAHDRRLEAGIDVPETPRTDIQPTAASGYALGQTPDGKAVMVLMFGHAQIPVLMDSGDLRNLASQALQLADSLGLGRIGG